MSFAHALRDIWAANTTLSAAITVATDETNAFFDEGAESFKKPAVNEHHYVVIDDVGDNQTGRGSQKYREAKHGYLIRIYTNSRALTESLAKTFSDEIDANLKGSESIFGWACDYTLDSQRLQKASGGLHMYRGQLSVTSTNRKTA